jgi:hypothetical protein
MIVDQVETMMNKTIFPHIQSKGFSTSFPWSMLLEENLQLFGARKKNLQWSKLFIWKCLCNIGLFPFSKFLGKVTNLLNFFLIQPCHYPKLYFILLSSPMSWKLITQITSNNKQKLNTFKVLDNWHYMPLAKVLNNFPSYIVEHY